MVKYCADFPGAPCCTSCHEDHDAGHSDLLDFYNADGTQTAVVCCGVEAWLEKNGRRAELRHLN